jgi:hypothetical protein
VQIIELEENLKRVDLTWQETVEAIVRLHALFLSDNPAQTYQQTAEAIGSSDPSYIAKYHLIWKYWTDDAVRACNTVNEAYNLLQRRVKRAQASKLDDWLGKDGGDAAPEENEDGTSNTNFRDGDSGFERGVVLGSVEGDEVGEASAKPAAEGVSVGSNPAPRPAPVGSPGLGASPVFPILHQDFLTWAPSYAGPKFNLIHCDFPYGIAFGKATHRSGANSLTREEGELYHDAPDHYEALLACLVANFDRFASESCHVMFWYSNRVETERVTREALLRIPGFSFFRYPLVWHKSDNAGFITPGHPRHIYETCLLGGRGERPIVKYVSDAYGGPTDNSLHMSAKPEAMLRYFMGMLVDEHSKVLDPTCGSGSALRAAESLKAEKVLGLETNPEMVRVANKALLEARGLRRASEGVGR